MAEFQSTPNAGFYGVFNTALGQALASNPTGLSRTALWMMANQGQDAYGDQLRRSQQAEYLIGQDNNRAKLAGDYLAHVKDIRASGGGITPDVGGYLGIDPDIDAQAGQVGIDSQVAAGIKDRAGAFKDLQELGYVPELPAVEAAVRGPLASGEYTPFMKAVAPSTNANDATRAKASMISAEADAERARKYDGHSGGGDDDKYVETVEYDLQGNPVGRSVRHTSRTPPAEPQGGGQTPGGMVRIRYKDGRESTVNERHADILIKNGRAVKVN